ncbi:hypothetical protein [Streptomyces botrytidirepellens]|uniref:hypothetical protein n=1 Tax=Streptomyces botrytidirepellens TaxID=2486417 RepID=UPI0011CE8E83|nr:hypothetical protein [Streptomyces botrytidirepellens]
MSPTAVKEPRATSEVITRCRPWRAIRRFEMSAGLCLRCARHEQVSEEDRGNGEHYEFNRVGERG